MASDLIRGIGRRDFIRLSLLTGAGLAVSLSITGCSPKAPGSGQASGPTGTFTVGLGADITSLDPQVTQSVVPRAVIAGMFDRLLVEDHDYKIHPWLATGYKYLDDNTCEFTLRENLQFHDGTKITAEDVRWSWQRFVDPDLVNPMGWALQPIQDIEVVNERTVRMVTAEPYSSLIRLLSCKLFIVPKAAMENMGEEFFTKPIGSGPYEFEEWIPGDRCVQKASRPHFSGGPHLEKVVWLIRTDPAARVAALKTGQADVIDGVPPERAKELSQTAGFRVLPQDLPGITTINLNCSKPPFDDRRVRQAVNYATNRQEILDHILYGAGKLAPGPLSASHEGCDPGVEPYEFNLEKARQLMKDAGYENGFDMQIHTPSGRYLKDREITEAVAGQWREIGIRAEVVTVEWGSFVNMMREKAWTAFFLLYVQADSIIVLQDHYDSGRKGLPWIGYDNPDVNAKLAQASHLVDEAKRTAVLREVYSALQEDAPSVFLTQAQTLYGVSDRVVWASTGKTIHVQDAKVK